MSEPFWRKEDPIVDKKGVVLKGGMWEPQRRWWDSRAFVKALITGYGGGKTFIGGKRGIALALHNAPSESSKEICPHLSVSPSYKIAKRTTIPTLRALLAGKQHWFPGFVWKENKSDHEFTIWYRGRKGVIWVASGDDPDSLRGPNVGSSLIDEPFIQDEEVMHQVDARTRSPLARHSEIGLTGTPEQLNWGYDICEGERKDDYDIEIIHASTRANKALSSDYADRLEKSFTARAAQAYVEGKFISLQQGQVYYAFDAQENIVDLPDPGGELGVGMDFNVNPMAACVFWVHGGHMHIMDEIELPNADTEYMCSYIKDNYKDKESEESQCRVKTIYPDASGASRSTKSPGGKSDFHYIKQAGFRVDAPPANPPVRDRENAVNGKLKSRDGKVTLTVSPRCKRLKGYLTKYNHEEKNKQKQMSHLLDALGYAVHRLFPVIRAKVLVTRMSGV